MQFVTSTIKGRVIVIGDIHGCLEQLQELLRKVQFHNERFELIMQEEKWKTRQECVQVYEHEVLETSSTHTTKEVAEKKTEEHQRESWSLQSLPFKLSTENNYNNSTNIFDSPESNLHTLNEDVCLFVGDLVNKGPMSFATVRFLRDIGAFGVLGNHDVKLLELVHKKERKILSNEDTQSSLYSLAQHCPDDVRNYLESLPYMLSVPQFQCVIVHAAVDPSVLLRNQQHIVLTNTRNLLTRRKYEKYVTAKNLSKLANEHNNDNNDRKNEWHKKLEYTKERKMIEESEEKVEEEEQEEELQSVLYEEPADEEKNVLKRNTTTALALSHFFAAMEKRKIGKAWAVVWESCFDKVIKEHSNKSAKHKDITAINRNDTLVNNAAYCINCSSNISNSNDSNNDKACQNRSSSSNAGECHKEEYNKLALCEELYSQYGDKALIVFGHDAGRGLQVHKHAIGLDSGCVYGRELSALILPTREIISVAGWRGKHHLEKKLKKEEKEYEEEKQEEEELHEYE